MSKQYASTTTLKRIRAASPCEDGYSKLLKNLGKSKADDEPLTLLTVLNSNGLDDALWVLSYAMPDDRLARHFQAWCAEQVLHIFERERPDDNRPRHVITVLRNDAASEQDRAAARDAAGAAAGAACEAGAGAAAWAAAWDAAWDAAGAAAGAAAWAAAWDAAWDAARDAARAAQEKQLRAMLEAQEHDGIEREVRA